MMRRNNPSVCEMNGNVFFSKKNMGIGVLSRWERGFLILSLKIKKQWDLVILILNLPKLMDGNANFGAKYVKICKKIPIIIC